MKIPFLLIGLFIVSSLMAQRSLKDSLFGGKLKSDSGKTFVSTDTSKYVPVKNQTISLESADKKKGEVNKVEVIKPDESMPDSLNKLYYAKQKVWKRFIESNIPILAQQADDTKKIKKGEYAVEIEYEIGLNGRVTIKGITSTPHNDVLIEQVTELMKRAPVLAPPIYSDGKPRTLAATQPITIIKK